jgi:hypothetical protein
MPVNPNAFNISKFQQNILNNGILQTNKFIVEIGKQYSNISELINFRAESVNIPGLKLDIASTRRYGIGPIQKIAQNVIFSDIYISFIDDKQNSIWKFLYAWLNNIFQFTGSSNNPAYTLSYKDDYISDILIHVFDNQGTEVTAIRLKEAFPTTLSDVSVSWAENNGIFRTTATFAYTEWEELTMLNGIGSDTLPVPPIPPTDTTPKSSNYDTSIVATNLSPIGSTEPGSYNISGITEGLNPGQSVTIPSNANINQYSQQ